MFEKLILNTGFLNFILQLNRMITNGEKVEPLDDIFTNREEGPPIELEHNKLLCLRFKLKELDRELQGIDRDNRNSLFKIIDMRKRRKRISDKVNKLNNQLLVLKVKEERKFAQLGMIAGKVEKASLFYKEKKELSKEKMKKENLKKIEMIRLRQNLVEFKLKNREKVNKSKELRVLKNKMIKQAVKTKNMKLKRKKIRSERKSSTQNQYKRARVQGSRKNAKICQRLFNRKTKLMKNRVFIEEWINNQSLIKKGLKEYDRKNRKYSNMIRNIFKAEDMLDKYKHIYNKIKRGKMRKRKGGGSKPTSNSLDLEYGFLPEIEEKKPRTNSVIDDGSTRRTTKKSIVIEEPIYASDNPRRYEVFTSRSRGFDSLCDIKGIDAIE